VTRLEAQSIRRCNSYRAHDDIVYSLWRHKVFRNLQQVSSGGKKSLSATYSSTKVFGPRPGFVWLGFDYSQQEGRIFADLAQVPVMLEALWEGKDLFKAMADKAWGGKGNPNSRKAVIQALDLTREPANEKVLSVWKRYGWKQGMSTDSSVASKMIEGWLCEFQCSIVAAEASIDKELCRQRCKHITYAKIFGGGPGSYTHLLYCSLEEAKIFDAEYNASMPEMKQYMKSLEKQAKRDGYIINLYDRKLRVDKNFAYRAVSYMIQGSAADMMKASLRKVDGFIRSTPYDAYLIITIHDELKVEIRESHLTTGFIRSIISRMEETEGRVSVPMPVECTITRDRWGVAEEKVKL
jgi:DNA polymerase I-like protein with 3'-5' exonuclease and polymerase domains